MGSRLNRRQFVTRATAAAGVATWGFQAPTILRAASADTWGDLMGRFELDGTAPPREKLKVDKDVECCGKFDIRDESLIIGQDNGITNVYVYVRSRSVDICPELTEKVGDEKQVVLDNRDCIFQPHCLSIWYPHQEFHTINSDPVGQNIAISPLGDKPWNVILPVGGSATYKFARKQNIPVPIACNYHPWESGYILPRDNPYVAITGGDGTFRIPKLPAGELEFQVWHERVGYLETEAWTRGRFTMTIQGGTNDLGTIKLPLSALPKK